MSVLTGARSHGVATVIGALSLYAAVAEAAPINEVDYFSLTAGQTIDFESITGGIPPGTNYDEVLNFDGVLIGERFVGQTRSFDGDFDVLSGSPSGPLSVVAGDSGQNTAVVTTPSQGPLTNILFGISQRGFPNLIALGGGTISILFNNDQSQFGIQPLGAATGTVTFDFFRRDGTLISSLTPTNFFTNFFGFSREGGVNDIAGISISNKDFNGIAVDNIIFDIPGNDFPVADVPGDVPDDEPVATPVSEPTTLGLLAVSMIGLRLASRRRRSP